MGTQRGLSGALQTELNKETEMVLVGLLVTLAGFFIALFSLPMASSVGGRMTMVLIGLGVSLVGIFAVLNPAYLKNAIWRK
ncbi:MAG: hypothetical protein ACRD9L_04400 [Bryobacteraceae bacterium]